MNFRGWTSILALILLGCGSSESSATNAEPLSHGPALELVVNDVATTESGVAEMIVGDTVALRLTGLRPGETVSVEARRPGLLSNAEFVADSTGAVDTATFAPVSGSYSGADVDGLFWSMTSDPASEVTDGSLVTFAAKVDALTLSAQVRPGFGTVAFERISEEGLVGVLARPQEVAAAKPAVLVLHGSEGSTSSSGITAGYLAAHGYVAFAPIWFGQPGQPKWIDQVPLEFFGKALAWLRAQPGVDPAHVAVVGTSRGGEAALLVGAYHDVQAVVGIVPSGIAIGGGDGTSSWTIGGVPVPFLTPNLDDVTHEVLPDGRTATRQSSMYLPALTHTDLVARAEIPVERTRGPILLLGGADDAMWPSCQLAGYARARLERLGHPYADALECYPDVGHAIGLPGLPTTTLVIEHPILHELLMLGGTPAGTAHAQRAASTRMVRFLDDALSSK